LAGALIMLLCNSRASLPLGEVFPKRSLNAVVGTEQSGRDGIPPWISSCSSLSKQPVPDHTLLTTYSSCGPLILWMLLWDRASPLSSAHSGPNLCTFQDVLYNLKCQVTLTNKMTATLIAYIFLITSNPSEEQMIQAGLKY